MRACRIGLLALAVVALLTPACVEVGDYGPFWDAQELDGALAGRWISVEPRAGEPGEVEFIDRGNAYVVVFREGMGPDEEADEEVRTLGAGSSRFLMARDGGKPGGMLTAYRVSGNQLEIFAVPDVFVGQQVPAPPPSLRYTRHTGAPATIAITRLDQPAIDWLAQAMRHAAPASVFARQR